MKEKIRKNSLLPASLAAIALGGVLSATSLHAEYSIGSIPINADGQFTVSNGTIHYWTAQNGYSTYDMISGVTRTIGKPSGGTLSNGFGDAFGVYDASSGIFYGSTFYGSGTSYTYRYNTATQSWMTNSGGNTGTELVNAYGGATHNGKLYVSGLAEPWNGGYGQSTFISLFDEGGRQDMLIETSGNSANLAVAANGDVYYGCFSPSGNNQLFRWTAEQVASVTDDLYAPDAIDHFLTLTDGEMLLDVAGSFNGLAVDNAGNVFFSLNMAQQIIGMLDPDSPDGYAVLYDGPGAGWYGGLSIDGNFDEGDPLYMGVYGQIIGISAVPEPSTYAAIAGLLALGFVVGMRRRRAGR